MQGSPLIAEGTGFTFSRQPSLTCVVFRGICITAGRGKRQQISACVARAVWDKGMAMGIHAVLSDSAAAPCLCFALLQGSGASMNPYCLLLILRGEPEKVEAQDPCPPPAIPSPCTAQPVFPLRCYRALPALLRALLWEGAGKLSCPDKPRLLSQHRFILHLCFHPTPPKYSCSQKYVLQD